MPPAPAPAEISDSYRRYALGLLLVVYVFNFIDRQILSILAEPIAEELDLSDTALGFLGGVAFAVFYTFAGIPIARWADRGTRRTIIALGLFVWSGMTALTGLSRSFTHLALARVGVGEEFPFLYGLAVQPGALSVAVGRDAGVRRNTGASEHCDPRVLAQELG